MADVLEISGTMLVGMKAADALRVWPDGHYVVAQSDGRAGMEGDAECLPCHYDYSAGMHEPVNRSGSLTDADITKFKQAIRRFASANLTNRAGDPVRIDPADAIVIGNIGQRII